MMRKLITLIVSGLIVIVPSTAQASPYYTENIYSEEYETSNYWWASWILDWHVFEALFLNYNYDYLNNDTEEVIPEPQPFFYPKAEVSDISFGFAPRGESIIPTNAVVPSPDYRCSAACNGATGSVGFAAGEVGYNDGIKVIVRDPSTGRIYETPNFDKVNNNWVAMGCDSNASAGCFTK
jgi:hypothetical protein